MYRPKTKAQWANEVTTPLLRHTSNTSTSLSVESAQVKIGSRCRFAIARVVDGNWEGAADKHSTAFKKKRRSSRSRAVSLLPSCRCLKLRLFSHRLWLLRSAQDGRYAGPNRRTKPGAWIPSGTCRIGSVIAGGDVVDFASGGILIEQRIDEADRFSDTLVNQRDQSSPERSHGARPSDNPRLP